MSLITRRSSGDVSPLVEHLFRTESGRLVAVLARLFGAGHVDLAEDVAQEALLAALDYWPRTGVPANPPGWLLQVARRKALDALRRERSLAERAPAIAGELDALAERRVHTAGSHADDPFADDQLQMMFLACHPAISPDSRVALTLRTVGGLGIGEIARAFLVDERAVAQRLVRAKRALRQVHAPFAMPAQGELPGRLDAVLDVLYLMFNEGHTAHEGEALLRRDLCHEALRLAELLLTRRETAATRVRALASLFCLHASRFDARTDAAAALVRLPDQDRARWDRRLIARGLRHLEASAGGPVESAYHLEAAIAACHAVAPSWDATEWPRIVALYDRLVALTGSPVAALNRIVAVREVLGPAEALRQLESLPHREQLARYHLFHGVRGDLLAALGRDADAAASLREALRFSRAEPVRRHLAGRLAAVSPPDVDLTAPRPSSTDAGRAGRRANRLDQG